MLMKIFISGYHFTETKHIVVLDCAALMRHNCTFTHGLYWSVCVRQECQVNTHLTFDMVIHVHELTCGHPNKNHWAN